MVETTLPRRQALAAGWLVRLAEVAAVGIALGLALRLRLLSLDAYTGSFDEGIRAQQLLLMAAGYRPFQDIFASQGPLLLDLLYPFYRLFGETLAAVRSGVVVCSLIALGGAWWTIRRAVGPLGGAAALGLLGLSPTFLEGSRLALAEVPSIAPALLALAAALVYAQSGRRWALVVSASCCALALLVKPMVLHLGVPLLVLLAARAWPAGAPLKAGRLPIPGGEGRPPGTRRLLLDLLLYALLVAAVCAGTILLLGPAQVWDNLGAYRSGAGGRPGAEAVANLQLAANVMRREQPGLYVLAAVGLALGLWRQRALTLALLGWGGAVVGFFALYGDLADKHIVYLVPPVALLAALGVGTGGNAALAALRSGDRRRATLLAALASGVGLGAYLLTLPAVYRADLALIREAPKIAAVRRDRAADLEIAAIIQAHTPPDGWVLADNPGAAFEARRVVIPYLVDTSGTRVDAGSLTTPLATAYVQQYQPAVIVTWPGRLGKLDDFVRGLPALGYRLEKRYEIGWRVYLRE